MLLSNSIGEAYASAECRRRAGHDGPMHPLTLARPRRFPRLSHALVTLLLLAVTACAAEKPANTTPLVGFTTDRGEVYVRVEVVDTPETRQRGLMGRTSLAEDAGMLFVWPEDASSAFHMKDTLIPLSIAFISADGVVLRILDMEPCTADPCPTYDPQTSYRWALEVNKGAFARWGVREGDTARRASITP